MSAVDDILAMREKKAAPNMAAPMGAMGHFGQALATGAGAGLAGAVMTGAGIAASSLYQAVAKARDFRTMMGSSFNADLHEYQRAKPVQFNEAYNSLHSVNPAVTKDPMTAGHYMRRMMEFDTSGAGGVILESLSGSKEMPKDSPFRAFQQAGSSAAASAMSPKDREKPKGAARGMDWSRADD